MTVIGSPAEVALEALAHNAGVTLDSLRQMDPALFSAKLIEFPFE